MSSTVQSTSFIMSPTVEGEFPIYYIFIFKATFANSIHSTFSGSAYIILFEIQSVLFLLKVY